MGDEFGVHCGAGFVLVTVEAGGHSQAGLSFGGAKEVEHLLTAIQRFASRVFGDFGEEAMLDGVPLGGARREVGYGHGEIERIAELRLEVAFQNRQRDPLLPPLSARMSS